MQIERYFREIEPPPGGLARLRARLHREPAATWRPLALAGTVAMLALTFTALLWAIPTVQERRFVLELETVFREASLPAVAINGQPVEAIEQKHDGTVIYWLGREPAAARRD